ncbi:MAG TPA: TIGR03435 family protein [Bryobacteraceae bacterium]|nr:TIGR03435 family protein [Bryobacteraceae bacterium]
MQAISWRFVALGASAFVFAQAAGKPEFEVASVKSAASIVAGPDVNIGIRIDGAQFSCSSYSLRDYMRYAYDVKPYQIEGPEWITQERYAVSAKIPEGEGKQVRGMLQSLLEDRFKLKTHRIQKEFPVYALVVGKGGIKMTEEPPDPAVDNSIDVRAQGGRGGVNVDYGHGSYFGFANNKLEGKKIPMPRFADMMSMFADRPVIDMTELKGTYDFSVTLSEEDYTAMLIRSALKNGVTLPPQALQMLEHSSGDTLFNAVQLLGLKLEPRKAPLDVIVVDSAEKTPVEN